MQAVEKRLRLKLVGCGRVIRWGTIDKLVPALARLPGKRERWVTFPDRIELAAHGAEPEGVLEASATDLTGVGHSLPKPQLRPLVEEHDPRTVDDVCLNFRDVDVFLNLAHSHHIVVGRPPYLNHTVVFVIVQTVRAEGIPNAVQAEHIAFAPVRVSMNRARSEEVRVQH